MLRLFKIVIGVDFQN